MSAILWLEVWCFYLQHWEQRFTGFYTEVSKELWQKRNQNDNKITTQVAFTSFYEPSSVEYANLLVILKIFTKKKNFWSFQPHVMAFISGSAVIMWPKYRMTTTWWQLDHRHPNYDDGLEMLLKAPENQKKSSLVDFPNYFFQRWEWTFMLC